MPDAGDDLYELADEPNALVAQLRPKPEPVLVKPLQLDYRTSKTPSAKSLQPEETIKNVSMPLWLLGGGTLVELIASLIASHGSLWPALQDVGMDLVVWTALMFGGIFLASKVRQFQIGNIGQAVYKVAALTVAPGAVMRFIDPILAFVPLGGLIALVVRFCLYFALLGTLFDLDESDTWFCVWTMLLIDVVVYIALTLVR